jgi:N-acetylglucosamine-6-phosphate deacetylase
MNAFDLQVNGYAGADFCSPALNAEQLHTACLALEEDGVDSILATVITDTMEALCAKLHNLARLRDGNPVAKRLIQGFHVEGPFLNPGAGWIGAHPANAVIPANPDDAQRLLDAGEGLVRIVTLAPECDPEMATIKALTEQDIIVSAGHCNPSLDQLKHAIDHGLRMFTHLGNGCPVTLPRHDNIINRVLHLADQLWIGFIPDGAHIDFFALDHYLTLTGIERAFVVTDAIVAARMGPGLYQLSGMEIEVDAEGVARRLGSPNLAGSTVTMPKIHENLSQHLRRSQADIDRLTSINPRRALGLPTPSV